MNSYLVVSGGDSPLRNRIVNSLVKQGWLLAVAADQAELDRHIEQHGAPALTVYLPGTLESADKARADPQSPGAQSGRTLGIVSLPDHADGETPAWLHLDDFVVWPEEKEAETQARVEVVVRVRRLLRGSAKQTAQVQRATAAGHLSSNGTPTSFSQLWPGRLSSSERCIVRKLEAANGQPVTMKELSDCVVASSYQARLTTLRVHINRLRKKVEADPAHPQFIVTVCNVGFRLNLSGAGQRRSTDL